MIFYIPYILIFCVLLITSIKSGAVYNRQTHEPLGNVMVGYGISDQTWLYTTAPDGMFTIELPYTTSETLFPLRIMLTSSNWHGMIHQTNVYIREKGEKKEKVNIYINSHLLESWQNN